MLVRLHTAHIRCTWGEAQDHGSLCKGTMSIEIYLHGCTNSSGKQIVLLHPPVSGPPLQKGMTSASCAQNHRLGRKGSSFLQGNSLAQPCFHWSIFGCSILHMGAFCLFISISVQRSHILAPLRDTWSAFRAGAYGPGTLGPLPAAAAADWGGLRPAMGGEASIRVKPRRIGEVGVRLGWWRRFASCT